MTFTGILSLPLELLDEIIAYVTISEILTLRCVNKALCRLVTPAAFREIVIHTTEKSTQGFMELLVNMDVVKHVKVVQVIEDPVSSEQEEERGEEARFERVSNRLRGAFFMLHLIPSLESLVITFYPDEVADISPFTYQDEMSRYQRLQFHVFEGLAYNPNPLPALQSLHINAWFALTSDLYAEAPFKRIVASLRDLHLNVQDTEYKTDHDNFTAHDFWPDVIGPRVLEPAVNLTSLSIESSARFGSLIRLDLSSIIFPYLTSLSLSNFTWDDTRHDDREVSLEPEDFIARHGKTLKKLKLCSCTICVPYNRSTPARSWETVWNRFASELTELVDLYVEYTFALRYVQYLPEYGYSTLSTYAIPSTEQDILALESLSTIVKGRKGLMATSK